MSSNKKGLGLPFIEFFYELPISGHYYKCKKCSNNKKNDCSGYTNLYKHLEVCVPNSIDLWNAHQRQNDIVVSFFGEDVLNFHSITELIIEENLSFSKLDSPIYKKLCKFEFMCSKTYLKYFDKLIMNVKENIRDALPQKFGLIFDGWTAGNGDHYVAVFAAYLEKSISKKVLISIAELDATDFSAESHKNYFVNVLAYYNRNLDDILFLVGDNCPTNIAIANNCKIPFIGCFSHRLNLAVKTYLKDYKLLLDKVEKLMIHFRTPLVALKLRDETPLKAIVRNVTRWSSTYEMIKRYLSLHFSIINISNYHEATKALCLSLDEHNEIELLFNALTDLEKATVYLQRDNLTLMAAKMYFEHLIGLYPSLTPQLGSDAKVVKFKKFESALFKLQKKENNLDDDELESIAKFRNSNPVQNISNIENPDIADIIEQQIKKTKTNADNIELHGDLLYIPPTSNIAERLFSLAKHVLTDYRASMSHERFEGIMLLKSNRSFWSMNDIKNALQKKENIIVANNNNNIDNLI